MPLGGKTLKAGRGRTQRQRVKISKTISVPPPRDTIKAQMTTIAKRVTARAIPNKVVGWALETNVRHNSAITGPDMIGVVQQIVKGDDSYNREGTRVKPKSLVVKGVISQAIEGNVTDTIPKYVRIVIAQQKNVRSVGNFNSLDATHFLKPSFAGAPEQFFTGATPELNFPVNRDLFRVYMDKIVLLTPTQSVPGTDPRVGSTKRWSYRFKTLPSTLTYDEGGGDYANNFAPFVALGYAYADGTAPDVATTQIVHNCYSTLTFEDA